MFSGIITEQGEVIEFTARGQNYLLRILAPETAIEAKIGSSICCDGVCLTVIAIDSAVMSFDLSKTTIDITIAKSYKTGRKINLEQSLTLNTLIEGHLVQGHVDCIAKVAAINKIDEARNMVFEIENHFTKYIVPKGSVTVNGVSLTIVKDLADGFAVTLIPYTLQNTNLGLLEVGDFVNIETDIFSRYIEKIVSSKV